MYFLVDKINKVIFGWSAKCGCSHIKKLYQFLAKVNHKWVHMQEYYSSPFPESLSGYNVIIVLRNPYDRIVSGYLDKYSEGGHYYYNWKSELPLTYRNFINEVSKGTYKMIHRHHFTQQLSEDWDKFQERLAKGDTPENILVYDLKGIDYKFIEYLYNVKIPDNILNFRGDHINKRQETIDYPVYDLVQTDYSDKKPLTKCFYNEEIAKQFYEFYKCDFEFAKKHGLEYSIVSE